MNEQVSLIHGVRIGYHWCNGVGKNELSVFVLVYSCYLQPFVSVHLIIALHCSWRQDENLTILNNGGQISIY